MRILSLFFVLSLISCNQEYISYETKDENKMVLNGFLYPDEPSLLTLSKVNNLFDGVDVSTDYIDEAIVTLCDLTTNESFDLLEKETGKYIVNHSISEKHKYKITASKNGFEDLETEVIYFETNDYSISSKLLSQSEKHKYIFRIFSDQEVEQWPLIMVTKSGLFNGKEYRIRDDFNFDNYPGVCYEQFYSKMEDFYIFDHNCRNTKLEYDIIMEKYLADTSGNIADKGIIELSIIPFEYYEYLQGWRQEGTFENGTLDPYVTSSNMKNGYGLVIPMKRTVLEF